MTLDLTAQYFPEIKQFSIEHLAGILYRCVDHSHPRWDADGNASKDFIDDGSIVNISALNGMTSKFLIISAYQEVRKTKPHMPEFDLRAVVYSGCTSQEVSNVRQRLMFLTDNEFAGIVANIPQWERRGYQEHFLGRDVWDQFYQRIRKDTAFLESRGYGRIKFG